MDFEWPLNRSFYMLIPLMEVNMKIIEALKKIKDLMRKADDIQDKVQCHCASYSHEQTSYGDRQKEQIDEWIQSHSDILKEVLRLKVALNRTNLETMVDIELGGKTVSKSIYAWIIRRRELASKQFTFWRGITDKGLSSGYVTNSAGERHKVELKRYYDPRQRDSMMEIYRSEPHLIDSTLEVVNAVTDLIE